MLKDITIGQYYPGESFLHRLDPRTKLICLFFYMIGIFMVKELLSFSYLMVFSIVVIAVSGVPVKTVFKGLKPMWILLLLTLILNFFMSIDGAILWQWRFLKITDAGVRRGIFMALRLVMLLNITALLTLTTTPILLTDGLERVMKRCFIPMAHELAMMMTIALRFIPTLIDETERIMKAQIARGADFETGGLLKKAKSLVPLLIPLFVSAIRRADELAMAMEARCYRGGEGRTRLRQLKYRRGDGLAFAVTMSFVAFTILDRYWLKLFV
ncbi:MAG: energy-coupling factor transporter transmembrane protein EcfT [Clostridiales bacterium]|nr:energy-coupling factor transporter transmembrane protein EcfT [Clostridiales bacterium]